MKIRQTASRSSRSAPSFHASHRRGPVSSANQAVLGARSAKTAAAQSSPLTERSATLRSPKTLPRQTTTGVRLLAADRDFLRDLARVQLISSNQAERHHYAHLKSGATRSLRRLEAAGLIRSQTLHITDQPSVKAYEFASREIAKAWGGDLPVTGAKRTNYHELLTSHAYFTLGRPQDFRLAARLTAADALRVGSCRPDAVFTDSATGELVVVEADSGHYSQQQIRTKMMKWHRLGLTRQVWVQPQHAAARVLAVGRVSVITVGSEASR